MPTPGSLAKSAAEAPALRSVPPYTATRSSMIQNSTVANVHGDYVVKEAFTEWQVPLLRGKPGAEELSLLVAGRSAEYTGSGDIWSWKWGLAAARASSSSSGVALRTWPLSLRGWLVMPVMPWFL